VDARRVSIEAVEGEDARVALRERSVRRRAGHHLAGDDVAVGGNVVVHPAVVECVIRASRHRRRGRGGAKIMGPVTPSGLEA